MTKKTQKPQTPQQSDENQSFELTAEELTQVAGAGTSSGGTGFSTGSGGTGFRYFAISATGGEDADPKT